ncbi:hypothetical protein FIA58_016980 [Flavobacterium jejuense]|uniref:Yip1 domain-containing protein n=1 Tax=Flavobacterium jejuense TaxID=1544455 RepID=A0ABX0IW04_9FLAO|nr:hypothetical protein [Flavobacterium jejuense]NHN27376.1 hypothetical protein [Flavobacterium jejuense]
MTTNKKNVILFISFIALTITVLMIGNNILNVDDLYYNYLIEDLTKEQANKELEIKKDFYWLEYLITTIFAFFKFLMISSVVYIGIVLNDGGKVKFKDILNVVMKSEFIFLFATVIKIIILYFDKNIGLVDIQNFYPLSAINITGINGVEKWLYYPLQVLNLFELCYMLLLSYYIGKILNKNLDYGLKVVIYSYLPSLFLWIILAVFISINLY